VVDGFATVYLFKELCADIASSFCCWRLCEQSDDNATVNVCNLR